MGNFALNGAVLWLTNTDDELCLFYKKSIEDVSHFFSDAPALKIILNLSGQT